MKKIKLFLVLIVLFISISAVSAEGNFTALQDEIDNSNNILEITQDYAYDNSTDDDLEHGILINKSDFTINGNGHTINALNQATIFNILGNNVTISNLKLINGYSSREGGAIYAYSDIILNNITFLNNNATGYGGALLNFKTAKIINCTFNSNTAHYGGSVCAIGGADILNSTFTNSTCIHGTGILSYGPLTITDSLFTKLTSTEDAGAISSSSDLKIKNCVFNNNAARFGGCVYAIEGADILNSTFTNSTSKDGTGIISYAPITITDSIFKNLTADDDGGAVISLDIGIIKNCIFNNNSAKRGGSIASFGEINISNTNFTNSKSEYATALYGEGTVTILDSIFANLSANKTAGAIGIKNPDYVEIDNCTFTNTSAVKNGGAAYIDKGTNPIGFYTHITNSKFFNCSGNFGGALVQLDGDLTLENSVFANNTALYDGGAIYISYTYSNMINNTFDSNKLTYEEEFNGGAIYCDFSFVNATESVFTNNAKNAIYTYFNELIIANCEFINNSEAIHGVFSEYDLTNITLENDTLFLNDTYYITEISRKATKLELINNTINVETIPEHFDLRDWGWVSSVKNQGDMGACWAFGSYGALESALLKATGIEYDFSENNMHSLGLLYSKYGNLVDGEGGREECPLEYLLSWLGPYPEEYDAYDELGKISLPIDADENIHIQDAILLRPRENATDNDAIKKAIMKYGSLYVSYYAYQTAPYYNENTSAQYQNNSTEHSHTVSVVGWDDNFSASNFLITPPGDGAWIIKNSWSTRWGENGYGYISYYDTSIFYYRHTIGFIIENTENYTRNYQTDLNGNLTIAEFESDVNYTIYYESSSNELISAVGTYFSDENETYSFEVYVNGELKHVQNGTAPYRGFHTVKLTKEIPIKKNNTFNVVMTKQSIPIIYGSRQFYLENMSFVNIGEGWEDISLEDITITLKVYTKDLNIYTQDLVKIYKNDSKFEANIGAGNETVTFEINGQKYDRISDENGTARLNINLDPGNYKIKTTFNGTTVENTITVLPTLIAANLVKYYRNASQFYIDLIDGKNNPVTDINITMNINGVFYNRTTNENGTAKLNINLNPGEYILTAIDPLTGLQMSYSITVLPTINATNLNMRYKDGSTFNASVVDGQGKPLANVGVTFNINGVFYTRYTGSDGIAKLNINLMPGYYIITSEYDGLKISNIITIKD